jgi:hypothetical protein
VPACASGRPETSTREGGTPAASFILFWNAIKHIITNHEREKHTYPKQSAGHGPSTVAHRTYRSSRRPVRRRSPSFRIALCWRVTPHVCPRTARARDSPAPSPRAAASRPILAVGVPVGRAGSGGRSRVLLLPSLPRWTPIAAQVPSTHARRTWVLLHAYGYFVRSTRRVYVWTRGESEDICVRDGNVAGGW